MGDSIPAGKSPGKQNRAVIFSNASGDKYTQECNFSFYAIASHQEMQCSWGGINNRPHPYLQSCWFGANSPLFYKPVICSSPCLFLVHSHLPTWNICNYFSDLARSLNSSPGLLNSFCFPLDALCRLVSVLHFQGLWEYLTTFSYSLHCSPHTHPTFKMFASHDQVRVHVPNPCSGKMKVLSPVRLEVMLWQPCSGESWLLAWYNIVSCLVRSYGVFRCTTCQL